ncbi:MAG: uridine kinase [Ruminococcaceae bacterium]|nr:uridine kinase [Oscillospiraceae bacterium]
MADKVMIIGIAGGSGSGKTTLAENIAAHFGERISLLRHDDYYKSQRDIPESERAGMNYDHPDAFDTELLIEHLDALKQGEAIDCPIYDYSIHDRSRDIRHVDPSRVIILEGILIFENRELIKRLDMKIFVDTDPDVRILRRIVRDVKKRGRTLDSVISQYLSTVKPMHEAFVEPSKKHADIIVPEGGKNPVAYGMLIDRIEKHLSEL